MGRAERALHFGSFSVVEAEEVVPRAGIEPARPLFTKAADFKSDVSTYFTTGARGRECTAWYSDFLPVSSLRLDA